MGRLTRTRPVVKVRAGADGRVVRRSDTLAVEEPLEVRLDGSAFLVTMRTPGDDIDLVHGLLHGERVIETSFESAARLDGYGVGYDTIAASGEHLMVPTSAKDFVGHDLAGFGASVQAFRAQLGGK